MFQKLGYPPRINKIAFRAVFWYDSCMNELTTLKDEAVKIEFAKYYGFMIYSLSNIRSAYIDLLETNKNLNEAFAKLKTNIDSGTNKLGRLDRVLKDYIILKIANLLFDKDKRAISFIQLEQFLLKHHSQIGENFSNKFKEIRTSYRKDLKIIQDNRDRVVAHNEKNEFESLMHTDDLLSMPILILVKRLEGLIIDLRNL